MCGIAGIVGPAPDENLLDRMLQAEKHRGPDGEGSWCAAGVALGHRRLKIIDLSEDGRQPMSTADGRYTITFNGEVYNYLELRRYFPEVQFRSKTDTEVILYAYAKWGPACLEHFIGMYSLAIWDSHKQELFCARDRAGIKPFYYTVVGEHFFFASEIKPLLAVGAPRRLNESILYDFLARDYYEHSNQTFFSHIQQLPAASWMIVRQNQAGAPHTYWDLAAEVNQLTVAADPRQREEKLLELCQDAVDLHLRSDVPVGITLSGGLDSATLLTLLDKVHPDPRRVESFSFVFSEAAYSERPFVEAMAEHSGRKANFVEVTPQAFTDSVEKFALSQEEPFAGLPISAYALCFEMARRHGFIVIMDGSGIDEILGGYDRFKPALWADYLFQGRWQDLAREWEASGIADPDARRQALQRMLSASSAQADSGKGQDLTASVRPECLTPELSAAASDQAIQFARPFTTHLKNLMYRELRYTKLPRALRFRDRLSMAVGAELRPFFLDHRLMAYAFALPAEDLIHQGQSKAILRRAAGRILPDAVRLAAKRSVQTPQREWFRSGLRNWLYERIDTPSFWQRGWVDRTKGLAAMQAFFNGQGDNSFFLWQWLNLELWAQHFLDPNT